MLQAKILIALTMSVACGAAADEISQLKQQNAELRRQNKSLLERIHTLEKMLGELQSENNRLKKETDNTKASLASSVDKQNELIDEKKRLEQLAGLTASGDNVKTAQSRIVSSYDETNNVTTVSTQSQSIDVARRGLLQTQFEIAFQYTYTGRDMKQPPTALSMILNTFDNNSTTAQKYRNAKTMGITIEKSESTIPVAEYKVVKSRKKAGRKRYDESIRISLDQTMQKNLAKCFSAQLRIASTNLTFTRDHAAMVIAMIKRIELGK